MRDLIIAQDFKNEQLPQAFRRLALGMALIATAVGGWYLASWLSGSMASQGLQAITMKTNTALCILLLGLAIVLFILEKGRRPLLIFAWICAGTAMLIGVLTLSENIFHWDLGIDQLLVKETPGAIGVVHPNRMGTPASLGFTMAGGSLLLIRRQSGVLIAQLLGFAVFLVGLLGIVGFIYQISKFYSVPQVTAVAWPTSLSLMLLGLGIIFSGRMKPS